MAPRHAPQGAIESKGNARGSCYATSKACKALSTTITVLKYYAPTSDLEPFAYTLSNAPLRMPHVVTTKKQSASNVESIMNLTLLGQN